MLYEDLYAELGKLFYHIAAIDGNLWIKLSAYWRTNFFVTDK